MPEVEVAPAWLMAAFTAVMAARGLTGADGREVVFAISGGQPLQYNNWRVRVWLPATQRAGLAGLHFHDLRSIAAGNLVTAGVDLKTAQTRLDGR